jgi:hypothetical protein
MEGDFTRDSDDLDATYSGVLMQQGRVQLDADWNEQWSIQTRALRASLLDLIGPHGGPATDLGFRIAAEGDQLRVGAGLYYVDGIRVRQGDPKLGLAMADENGDALIKGDYVVYLDVWERHVNPIEDPRIREVALLGPDTATRAEVVWRLRLLQVSPDGAGGRNEVDRAHRAVETLARRPHRRLAARARTTDPTTDPCLLAPTAQYRGRENQLYRVEIHASNVGRAGNAPPVLFTYKWSRDNGSTVFPIVSIAGPTESSATPSSATTPVTVQLGHLGRDARYGLEAGHIVEFVHDRLTRGELEHVPVTASTGAVGRSGLLGRVSAIDPDAMSVQIEVFSNDLAEIMDQPLHPYLRRWDQAATSTRALTAGAVPVRETDLDTWIELEDGVEVRFESQPNVPDLYQRCGAYWLIPARTVLGDVLWPTDPGAANQPPVPRLLAPAGPRHHLAPLAWVEYAGPSNTPFPTVIRTRRRFTELAVPE